MEASQRQQELGSRKWFIAALTVTACTLGATHSVLAATATQPAPDGIVSVCPGPDSTICANDPAYTGGNNNTVGVTLAAAGAVGKFTMNAPNIEGTLYGTTQPLPAGGILDSTGTVILGGGLYTAGWYVSLTGGGLEYVSTLRGKGECQVSEQQNLSNNRQQGLRGWLVPGGYCRKGTNVPYASFGDFHSYPHTMYLYPFIAIHGAYIFGKGGSTLLPGDYTFDLSGITAVIGFEKKGNPTLSCPSGFTATDTLCTGTVSGPTNFRVHIPAARPIIDKQ